MARVLTSHPPTSSVARLLDMESAARALAPCSDNSTTHASPATATFLKREFVLSEETNSVFQSMLDAVREGTRTRLTASHLMRAMILVFADDLDTVARELDSLAPGALPSNAKAKAWVRVQFERRIAAALRRGLKPPEGPSAAGRTWGPTDAKRF